MGRRCFWPKSCRNGFETQIGRNFSSRIDINREGILYHERKRKTTKHTKSDFLLPGAAGEVEEGKSEKDGNDGDNGGFDVGMAEVITEGEHHIAEVAGLALHGGGLFFVITVQERVVGRFGVVNGAKKVNDRCEGEADQQGVEANFAQSNARRQAANRVGHG